MGNPTLFADAAPAQPRYAAQGFAETPLDVTPSASSEEGAGSLRGGEGWPPSLDPSCLRALERLSSQGLALTESADAPVFSLSFGGEVPKDGSCLFAAVAQAAGLDCTPAELRHRCVKRVLADAGAGLLPHGVEGSLQSTYNPDLVRVRCASADAAACGAVRRRL